MNRPYIICHMVQSIDGKVTGDFLSAPESEATVEAYYEINRELRCNGFICGRVTMEGSFTGGCYPDLSAYSEKTIGVDFIPKNMTGFYAVACDPKGRLGWKAPYIEDEDPGYDKAQIFEVLTEQVAPRYLGYLQSLEIPYIFAGKTEIDVVLALSKLKNNGIEKLLLEGGSIINGAFQRAGVIDEISLVLSPVVADKEDRPLFTDGNKECYKLTNAENKNGVAILNFRRNNNA